VSTLGPEEQQIVELVARWVDDEVRPVVNELEHSNTYPEKLIEQMKQMGVYGLAIPEPFGDFAVSARCYARVTEEIARGWMSLAGAFGGHSVVSKLILRFGTEAQQRRYLPRMATGELRATMALTEPDGGSDLQAIRTVARPVSDGYVINGSKTWITNARMSGLVALLCKTDPTAEPAHTGISILLVEKVPGFTVSRDLPKLGYKGVESCELHFDDCHVPADALLGGVEGKGFSQMMTGLETGRIQVAGRAIGVARAAFDDALRYAQDRQAFGVPIWQHQSVGNLLADMATQITAGQQLNYHAADCIDAGRRADMEAGMAKLFCSEMAAKVCLDAIRVHGGHGYSTEFDVERYYRDAPLMIVGEGTNEVLRNVIVKQAINRNGLT
jgi:alkylation response protein AidB-like acyl-CoA dehydrogenase